MAGGDKCALGHALLIAEGLKEGVCLGFEGKLLLVFPQSQLVKDSLAGLSMGGGMDSCLIEPRISDQKLQDYKTISPTNARHSQGSGGVKEYSFD